VRRRRLDLELVRRGLAATRSEARDAILAGRVTVSGSPAGKPGSLVAPDQAVDLTGPARPYASRGGEKLSAALDALGIDPAGRRCLDAGASTGGFTDVLLTRGADHVVAVDVGYGQLAWRLREDPRVTVMERTNARSLAPGDLPYPPDLVVSDLSFISLVAVVPSLIQVSAPNADLILLVKPQFEVGREHVGRGGVVTESSAWRRALDRVAGACEAHGAGPRAAMASPLTGPAGNVELFLHARKGQPGAELDLDAVLAQGHEVRAS
jgi:23S rRNA (cytidine1920-2'-O)/16S rRNA (cytidine1409-2'-O)-methyltransferase